MRKIIFILSICYSFSSINGQSLPPVNWVYLSSKEKEESKELASKHLNLIKENGIAVRFEDYKDAIDELEAVGNYVYADDLKAKVQKRKKEELSAFKKNYSFSPVYFYNGSDANLLIEHGDKSVLYDVDEKPVDTSLISKIYLTMYQRSDFEIQTTKENFYIYEVINGRAQKLKFPFPQMIRFRKPFLRTTHKKSVKSLNEVFIHRSKEGW